MSPAYRPPGTGALWVATFCVAALTVVLGVELAAWQDRGPFVLASDSLMTLGADAALEDPTGR